MSKGAEVETKAPNRRISMEMRRKRQESNLPKTPGAFLRI